MVRHLVVAPGVAADRLLAELLGEGDADRFGFAVGVIGADGDPEAIGLVQQHELDLAARIGPGHLDRARGGEQLRGDAIEDGRRLRRPDADFLELADVLAQRRLVAASPAGDHHIGELVHLASAALAASEVCAGIGGMS